MALTLDPAQAWPFPQDTDAEWARILPLERAWIASQTRSVLLMLIPTLDSCLAVLSPSTPPTPSTTSSSTSTLVVSTPHAEKLKGTVTRSGTALVRGSLAVQLRTQPPTTLTLDPRTPVVVAPLESIRARLARCVALAAKLSSSNDSPEELAARLAEMACSLQASVSLLAGASAPTPIDTPLAHSRPTTAHSFLSPSHTLHRSRSHIQLRPVAPSVFPTLPAPEWTTLSASPSHFSPPAPPTLSMHISVANSLLVITLRALEPADAPINIGTKLGLAFGTVRRLEHDEMDRVFWYCPHGEAGLKVYVREKVMVESADPSLLALAAKMASVGHALEQARRNLADVLGIDE